MRGKRSFLRGLLFVELFCTSRDIPVEMAERTEILRYPNACVCVRMCEHTRECPVLISRWWISLSCSMSGHRLYILVDSERILRGWIFVCFFSFMIFISSSTVLFLRSETNMALLHGHVDITAMWIYWKCPASRRKSKPLSSRNSNTGIVECFMIRCWPKVSRLI